MATRRQREAAAPRPAANAGPRNQTAAAARSGPRNHTAAAGTAAARSDPRNQTAAAAASAARSGSRNQTAAAVAAPSRPRNQTTIAAANGRPHARNRRALGDIGNQVNAPVVVDGEANRCCSTRSLSAQPNAAAAADENTIAPAHPTTAVDGVGMAVSDKNKKLSKEDNIVVVPRAEMERILDSLMKAVDEVEALEKRYEETAGDNKRLVAETNRLESEKAHKEAQVQRVMKDNVKVMEENVKLHSMLDKKEAQLLAMSEQCKFMALNQHN